MLSEHEVIQMHKVQADSMHDLGFISSLTYTVNPIGEPVTVYVDGPPIRCGFRDSDSLREKESNVAIGINTVRIDGRVRFPLGTVVNSNDRFTLVSRRYETIQPIRFEIVSHPMISLDGITCDLKAVNV